MTRDIRVMYKLKLKSSFTFIEVFENKLVALFESMCVIINFITHNV